MPVKDTTGRTVATGTKSNVILRLFQASCILLSNWQDSLTFQIEPTLMRLLLSIKVTSLTYPSELYEPRQIKIDIAFLAVTGESGVNDIQLAHSTQHNHHDKNSSYCSGQYTLFTIKTNRNTKCNLWATTSTPFTPNKVARMTAIVHYRAQARYLLRVPSTSFNSHNLHFTHKQHFLILWFKKKTTGWRDLRSSAFLC